MIDPNTRILLDLDRTFTRSDGTMVARLYERLTKRSRRRRINGVGSDVWYERAYRQGVYDAYKTLQEELDDVV